MVSSSTKPYLTPEEYLQLEAQSDRNQYIHACDRSTKKPLQTEEVNLQIN